MLKQTLWIEGQKQLTYEYLGKPYLGLLEDEPPNGLSTTLT